MPAPRSDPFQEIGKLVLLWVGSSLSMLLTGFALSIVFSQTGVDMAGLVSKTTLAELLNASPVTRLSFGMIVNRTAPCPSGEFLSGGNRPAIGSSGGCPV